MSYQEQDSSTSAGGGRGKADVLRTAVIGCGLIGSRRAAIAAGHGGTRLELVVDVREDRARALASKHGCRWAADWRAALVTHAVDIVVVSTTNDLLAPIALTALEAGKDVLIEKPMGRDVEEARRLVGAAAATGRRLKVGFNHRYHPAVQRARQLVKEGRLGALVNARARYGHGGRAGYENEWRGDPARAGGGELTDQGVHVLDLLHCFFGPPADAFCTTQTAVWPVAPLEDNAFAVLRYPTGAVASFHTSWTQWKNLFSLELFGTDGYLTIDGLGGSYGVETLTVGRRRPEGGVPSIEQESFPGTDDSWRREWDDFVDGIVHGTRYEGAPDDGLDVMRALDALYRSARSTPPIMVPLAAGGS